MVLPDPSNVTLIGSEAAHESVVIDAERAVLGAMMSAAPDTLVNLAGRIEASDFWRPAHGTIFDVITGLWARDIPPDPLAVFAELGRRATEEGATPYFGVQAIDLSSMINAGRPGMAGHYAQKVADASYRRRATQAMLSAAGRITNGADVEQEAAEIARAVADHRGSARRWPDPMPLSASLPSFPVECLPDVLGRITLSVAATTQTAPELAAFVGLAVLSAATRGHWEIEIKPAWIEQTALYLSALADSGERKSPVFREMGRPLRRFEKEQREKQQAAYAEDKAAYDILKRRVDAAMNAAAKVKATLDDEANARGLARELAETRPPALFRLLADDATPEQLPEIMAGQDGPIAILSSEGGLFGTLAGRYSGMPNIDLVLKAYDCERYQSDRVNRGHTDIDRPFLAMGMIVQPDVIAEAMKVPGFVARGFLPRNLFCLPATTRGTRALNAPDVPDADAIDWDQCVRRVLQAAVDLAGGEPRRLHVDSDALRILDGLRSALEPRLHPQLGDLADIAAWASKLAGTVVRIAGLFALAADPGTDWIRAGSMKSAVGLADYLIAHARAAFTLDAHGEHAKQAAVVAWVRRKVAPKVPEVGSGAFGTAFTARDAWRGLHGQAWVKKSADVEAVLDELVEMGWLRHLPGPPRTAGRPPSRSYEPHPHLISSPQVAAAHPSDLAA